MTSDVEHLSPPPRAAWPTSCVASSSIPALACPVVKSDQLDQARRMITRWPAARWGGSSFCFCRGVPSLSGHLSPRPLDLASRGVWPCGSAQVYALPAASTRGRHLSCRRPARGRRASSSVTVRRARTTRLFGAWMSHSFPLVGAGLLGKKN